MYHAELTAIMSALESERENRSRFGMDTSTLDEILARAEALAQVDPATLASLVDGAQALVASRRSEIAAQLAALDSLII